MATWDELDTELRAWADAGEVPTFWWRDDDTEECTDDLERLIGLSEKFDTPLHLAVVPAQIDPGLGPRLAASPGVYVLQHGFAHKNHEPKDLRASEVGVSRDTDLQIADLKTGWQRMLDAGLPRQLPVMVPPWSRIADKMLPELPGLGYQALSTFYKRPNPAPVPALKHFNCHIDPIRWKEGAKFSGTEKTLEQCVGHLRERRLGEAEKNEPTGFVTHHLQTDDATWEFSAALVERLTFKGATQWKTLADLLKGQ